MVVPVEGTLFTYAIYRWVRYLACCLPYIHYLLFPFTIPPACSLLPLFYLRNGKSLDMENTYMHRKGNLFCKFPVRK